MTTNDIIDVGNRYIDKFGNVIYKSEYIVEKIYSDDNFINYVFDDSEEIKKFNKILENLNLDLKIKTSSDEDNYKIDEKDIKALTNDWLIPEEYKSIDIENWFFSKELSEKERERVEYELSVFKKHNGYDLLRFLIYLVDFMKEKGIVWGAGRGSSVASYCLYLIGIHRINSLEYDLDFNEFLK